MRKFFPQQAFSQLIYRLVLPVILLLLAPRLIFKMLRRKDTLHGLLQRLGKFSPEEMALLHSHSNGIWIHAVSVGEVNIAVHLIKEWQQKYPSLPIFLTTTTSTGRAVAQNQLGTSVGVLYNPVDLLPVVSKFFDILKPKLIVLVESELWPNCLWEAERRAISVALVNARVSKRSEKFYTLLSVLMEPLYDKISIICAQSHSDVERLLRLGARKEAIRVVDSMKFDVSVVRDCSFQHMSELLLRAGFPADAKILLGGSTHAGEEEVLAQIHKNLLPRFPNLRLILVPRHTERCASIFRKLSKKGYKVVLKKQLDKMGANSHKDTDILLVDTTGELKYFYSVSDVTFIGKSLCGRGGQNFLEPIQFGHPVIVGPYVDNFAELIDFFVSNNAILQVNSVAGLEQAIVNCLEDPGSSKEMAMRAKNLFERRLGATKRTIQALDPLVGPLLEGTHMPR